MIYFIQSDEGPIKIGHSLSVQRRLVTLQTNSPRPLTLLAAIPGGRTFEKKLHEKFHHIRECGEWFQPSDELLSFIKEAVAHGCPEAEESRKIVLLPNLERQLAHFGENIKLARLRRRLSAETVSERANISRPTLRSIEYGESGVSIGNIANVLLVLGLSQDLTKVAMDDVLGKKLQDAGLLMRRRAPKRMTLL